MTDNTDRSLLRCTYKKSIDTTKKLVLWASYAIVGIAAFAALLYVAISLGAMLVSPTTSLALRIYEFVSYGFSVIISVLLFIPWYVYAGIVIIAAIPTYSFLWCVGKELTEEDWKSNKAYGVGWLLIVALYLVMILVGCILDLRLLVIIIGALIINFEQTRVFSFLGAYLRYRKRIAEVKE